jgi:hypothetical protein
LASISNGHLYHLRGSRTNSRVEPQCSIRRRGELLLPAAFAKVPVSQSSS